jgi:hypothetical protein
MTDDFKREYLLRLPMPLAQLYGRAHNAKDGRGRDKGTVRIMATGSSRLGK